MNANAMGAGAKPKAVYETPQLTRLGFFHAETKSFCVPTGGLGWGGKTGGGYDGHTFNGQSIPISSYSG